MRMTRPGRRELWSRGDEQQHPKPRYFFECKREQFQRGRVRPMDILKDDEHWLLCRQCVELSQECRQRHLLALLRTQLGQAVAVAERQRQKVGQSRHHTVRVTARPQEQSF